MTHQTSLLQGDALAHHVDVLEQLLQKRLDDLRSLPDSRSGQPSAYELQLCHDLGLVAGELRRLYSEEDGVPF